MRAAIVILFISTSFFSAFGQDGFIAGSPKLAYWKLGAKPEVLIVLHGGPACHHEYLRPELDDLSDHATMFYYDQRGCGKSEHADRYLWQDHVDDLHRLIKIVARKKKVFLVGSSWGSLLGLLYAYKYPQDVKGLILSGTVKWLGEAQPYVRREKFIVVKPQQTIMREKKLIISTDDNSSVYRDTVNIQKVIDGEFGTQFFETLASTISAPISDSLARIRVPILIFKGNLYPEKSTPKYDWVEEYMKLLPNVTIRTFEVAGHDPWFSDPMLFAAETGGFIRKYK